MLDGNRLVTLESMFTAAVFSYSLSEITSWRPLDLHTIFPALSLVDSLGSYVVSAVSSCLVVAVPVPAAIAASRADSESKLNSKLVVSLRITGGLFNSNLSFEFIVGSCFSVPRPYGHSFFGRGSIFLKLLNGRLPDEGLAKPNSGGDG